MIKYISLLMMVICCFSCSVKISSCEETVNVLGSESSLPWGHRCDSNQKAEVEEKVKPNGEIVVIVKCVCAASGEKEK